MPQLNTVFPSSEKNNKKRGPFLRGRSCPRERQKKQGPSPSQALPAEVWCPQGPELMVVRGPKPTLPSPALQAEGPAARSARCWEPLGSWLLSCSLSPARCDRYGRRLLG